MKKDISKQTINVLFLLTVVVLLLGAFTVYLEAEKVKTNYVAGEYTSTSSGRASLSVGQEPVQVVQTGEVTLTIVDNGGTD